MPDIFIPALIESQRIFFKSGATLSYTFRLESLRSLHAAILASEKDIEDALAADLGKSAGEAYFTEVGQVLSEITVARKNLRGWMKPHRVPSPLILFPAKSRIYPEPFGLTLNISPWNYPFHLALLPVIGSIAAGNCVILKPSSRAGNTAAVIDSVVRKAFSPHHVAVVLGSSLIADILLQERFDFIMYTGSARIGKKVMAAASRNLTPLCLELGGKSPAIVCADADLHLSARRIIWGKMFNAGQTCVAPDYVLAHRSIKGKLESLLEKNLQRFPGPDALNNSDYCRIINEDALERLIGLAGGKAKVNRRTLRMAPLLMPDVDADAPVMQEEIFGPLLPILAFDSLDESLDFVKKGEKPLACYLFTQSRRVSAYLLEHISFGGGCVNDTILQAGSHFLPFGGVGHSGMGRYHGAAGFALFSNMKGVVHKGRWFDFPLRYPPFKGSALFFLKWMLR